MLAHPRLWIFAVIVWAAALWLLSGQSSLHPPGPEFANRDKVMHATYFALGGTCLFLALRLKKRPLTKLATCLIVVGFCSLVGVVDEYHQSFIPNRSGNDVGDWLADTVGGVIACCLGSLLYSFLRPKTPDHP